MEQMRDLLARQQPPACLPACSPCRRAVQKRGGPRRIVRFVAGRLSVVRGRTGAAGRALCAERAMVLPLGSRAVRG